jgi:catechol 2,3-dioxygenase-like lactoylglutathione lyase family enzyme
MTPRTPTRFRVTMMNHPSHHVPDLVEAEAWFARVFERSSVPFDRMLGDLPVRPDWPMDYCIFTLIDDVLVDCIDPTRYVVDGVQQYPTAERPHLKDLGWYVDGLVEAYRAVRANGIRVVNTLGELQEGDEPSGPNRPAPFFSLRDDAGLRYHFHAATHMLPGDPRRSPEADRPGGDEGPLGIECCACHTVLTDAPDRALRLFVDSLGGELVHRGRNEVRGTSSTYVHLAGSILEFGVPDAGTAAFDDWARDAPHDTYHAITWKIADLERAERHLEAQGVRIRARSQDMIVTDPATSLGIPWGFTTSLTPGDPRARA